MVSHDVEEGGIARLQAIVGRMLLAGVLLSLALEASGIILYLHAHGGLSISQERHVFIRGENFFLFLFRLAMGHSSEGIALQLMTLGVVVLMLTPYARAIFSCLYFAFSKNRKYFFITLFVLLVLTASLMMH